MINETK